ncbi:Hypp4793 [Branchiostoma lanceolatum]|uniref:Hypp4793 protein n=1 Tax=Branchiostoma lanceolatum TaxID=7740 RepID=A0A8K0ABH5_BRALA|nr:Hypp4793 [Branchiostoma lanceolatum]
MSQHADKLAEVTAEISARTKALCPLTAERPETPVNTDDEAVGVRHGHDVIGHKLTSLKSPTGKTLADFVQRKIKRDERLQRLFRKKAVALAAKIGGNGTLGTGPTGHPATAYLRHQRSASSERPDGRLQHNLGQSETPPGGQATDRMPPPKHPVHRSFQPRRLFQPAIPLQVGGKAQAQSRPLAETAVAGSSRDVPQGHGDENYNRSRRRPSTLQTSRPTPLRSRPIHVVYTQEEIAQGIRSIRNQMMENDRTSEAPLRQQLGGWERRHDNKPADIHGQQKASRLTYMTSGPTSLEVLENNNKLQVAGNSPPPVEPPAAVMAVKADHSTILGSVTWGSIMTQSQYNTATAMAIPCMIPTTIVLAEGSCDAAATATVTQPLTPEDRIPLEEAIAMLVGREAEDNPSHCKDSPLITTGKSSIHSGFDSNLERARSSSDTSAGKRGRSKDSTNTSLSTRPTNDKKPRHGSKRSGSKNRARSSSDTAGTRTKPLAQNSYETPREFGITPSLSLTRYNGGMWHSYEPVKSLSKPPPLPPPRPPWLDHVKDSPPPTSPGSPRLATPSILSASVPRREVSRPTTT